ncbi:MAG: hypothetical protein KAW45_08610 [Thermoplasmatales archaeon]|nr:hypothetical protein [Thermoplasmatales archaeon]
MINGDVAGVAVVYLYVAILLIITEKLLKHFISEKSPNFSSGDESRLFFSK